MKVYRAFTVDDRLHEEYAEDSTVVEVWETSESRLRTALIETSAPAFVDGGEIAAAEELPYADPEALAQMRAALLVPVEWCVAHYDLGPVTAALVMQVLRQKGYARTTMAEFTILVHPTGHVRRGSEAR